ncbi:MAG: PTS sugar transporter subunit IIA [Victivallaceae bacterium]
MSLAKYFTPDFILLRINPQNKSELFEQMVDCVMNSEAVKEAEINRQQVIDAIISREKISPTGIGDGFGFPHARIPQMDRVAACLAVMGKAIEYDSGVPVQIACMVLAPEKNPTMALKVMSQVVRLFSEPGAKEFLHDAASTKEVHKFIKASGANLECSILARDIMRNPILEIRPDELLRKVTRKMAQEHINVVPVVDAERHVIGEISCERLFQLGIPDFFNKLKSVKFISEFDPFEKYFHEESEAKAADAMLDNFCTMPMTATILEIVFALSVQRYQKIYVINDNKLVGVIDRSIVLEKIINI